MTSFQLLQINPDCCLSSVHEKFNQQGRKRGVLDGWVSLANLFRDCPGEAKLGDLSEDLMHSSTCSLELLPLTLSPET